MVLLDNNNRDYDAIRSAFRWPSLEHYNIGVQICDRHENRHDAVALYCENAHGEEFRVTFGELKRLSNRFANALAALDVERGDRVAIILPQRYETVVAHIAVYKLGAVALPLSVLFGPDALDYRLRTSGTSVVVTDAEHAQRIEPLRDALPALRTIVCCDAHGPRPRFPDLIERAADAFNPVLTGPHDPALLIFTSGTTGPPKGALNAHRCLLGNLPGFELSHDFFPQAGDLMYTPADWAWTGGLMDGLIPALNYGVPVLGFDGGRFDPERALALMARYEVRNAFIPPTAMKMLMQVPELERRSDLSLRSIMSAGEQVGVEVLRFAREALGVQLNEMWGQTEFNYLAGSAASVFETRPGSMGKAYPGHDVAVVDAHGQPVPDGEVGGLAARRDGDPVHFLGYWNDDAATQENVRGPWWLTGDQGYRDTDGYLWYVGRTDDVISSAGHRIGPGEIEDCLLKHPAVAEAAVIGTPDPMRGQAIKA
ncbi:MAG: AMP-binding protein, partial [Gammaproteobacteria bacterium]